MLPEAFLLGAICAILLVDLYLKPAQRAITHWLSLAAVLGTIILIAIDAEPAATAFNGMYVHDGIAAVLRIFVLGTTGTVFVYARGYLQNYDLRTAALHVRDLDAEALLTGQYDNSSIRSAKAQVQQARAVIVATPVYKAAYSGALSD